MAHDPQHSQPAVVGFGGAVGNTHLIELKSLSKQTGCKIYAKAEMLNPGGSVKDRASKWMVEKAEREGHLLPGGTIVEGTGGNTGIGLAMVGLSKGYRCVLVMPDTIASEKIALMRLLGCEVHLQPVVPFSDPRHYYHTAQRLASEREGAYFTNQFENLANSQAHYEGTAPEIWHQLKGSIDGFVCASGTGGTIGGCTRYFKERNPAVRTYLIDPLDSCLYSYVTSGELRSLGKAATSEGIGIGRITANFASAKLDGAFSGTDREAVEMAYYLLRTEGLMVGPSSALNCCGAVKLARMLPPGSTIVTILCDLGERYKSKLWDAEWLKERELTPAASGVDVKFVL